MLKNWFYDYNFHEFGQSHAVRLFFFSSASQLTPHFAFVLISLFLGLSALMKYDRILFKPLDLNPEFGAKILA